MRDALFLSFLSIFFVYLTCRYPREMDVSPVQSVRVELTWVLDEGGGLGVGAQRAAPQRVAQESR